MNLFSQMAATGLYRLHEGSISHCELSALQTSLEDAETHLVQAGNAGDFSAMPRERLEAWCRLCGLNPPVEMADEALRKAVIALLRGCGRTCAEITAYLESLGAQVDLIEEPDKARLLVRDRAMGGLCDSTETLQQLLRGALPAQLTAALDVGWLTWEMLDAAGLTAQSLDDADFTWAWFDLYGHRLVQEIETTN